MFNCQKVLLIYKTVEMVKVSDIWIRQRQAKELHYPP